MTRVQTDIPLSIVIAVVTGQHALKRCLDALCPQAEEIGAEIIVPYDSWTRDVLELSDRFEAVRFVEVSLPEALLDAASRPINHALYDLRRGTGLAHSRGRLIALTEDHAVPAADWCRQIIRSHEDMKSVAVIGGAIENEVDSPFNWAWYYCDFGRYGRPIEAENVEYLSDVNVSYKREAIMAVKELWEPAFHETTVHWALRRRGRQLRLDGRPVVFQHRLKTSLQAALRERIEWGRAFAATRTPDIGRLGRALLLIGCSILPLVLFQRAVKNMLRQRRSLSHILRISPLTFVFVTTWSIGEAIGYLTPPEPVASPARTSLETSVSTTL